MLNFHIHKWNHFAKWFPSRDAIVAEYAIFGKECAKCGCVKIDDLYNDRLQRPKAYNLNGELIIDGYPIDIKEQIKKERVITQKKFINFICSIKWGR